MCGSTLIISFVRLSIGFFVSAYVCLFINLSETIITKLILKIMFLKCDFNYCIADNFQKYVAINVKYNFPLVCFSKCNNFCNILFHAVIVIYDDFWCALFAWLADSLYRCKHCKKGIKDILLCKKLRQVFWKKHLLTFPKNISKL